MYEGQDKNPEMCRVLLTHEVMCRWVRWWTIFLAKLESRAVVDLFSEYLPSTTGNHKHNETCMHRCTRYINHHSWLTLAHGTLLYPQFQSPLGNLKGVFSPPKTFDVLSLRRSQIFLQFCNYFTLCCSRCCDKKSCGNRNETPSDPVIIDRWVDYLNNVT